ncbi:MAG: nitroreductase family protein [Lachnospiraceae bacterium]|nr:nitroreductase family protein [Lachnospiraceae bacterium]
MEVKEALLKRRSVRKFTDEPVLKEQIEELLHAAMSGPSACNRQPWEFYVITNESVLEELKTASKFSKMSAKLAIIVCGNVDRALPDPISSYWIQDCSAATENILLRAVDLGLGAVWCGLHPQRRPEEKVRGLLGIDEKQIPMNIIYIGHPAEEPGARDQYDEERVHYIG